MELAEALSAVEPTIKHYSYRYTIPGWTRDDILQELRLEFVRAYPTWDPAKGSLRTFADRVLSRKSVDIVRHQSWKKRDILPLKNPPEDMSPEDSVVDKVASIMYIESIVKHYRAADTETRKAGLRAEFRRVNGMEMGEDGISAKRAGNLAAKARKALKFHAN